MRGWQGGNQVKTEDLAIIQVRDGVAPSQTGVPHKGKWQEVDNCRIFGARIDKPF